MPDLLQNPNRERFDMIASGWDASPRRQELAAAVAEAIAVSVPLQPHWQALEYGCGTGLVGARLAPLLHRLLATDISPGMLSVLAEKARDAGLRNVETRPLDLTRDPPPADRFDLVFSSMTLHHIPDVPALFRVFNGMIQPGGWIAVADLDAEDGTFHDAGVQGVAHHGFDRAVVAEWLRDAGFADIAVRAAHTVEKTRGNGLKRRYPVFLATARRDA